MVEVSDLTTELLVKARTGLKANGFTTVTVEDGRSVIALARDSQFDLLVLDLGLPLIDGMEALRAIRTRGDRLPVVILTARDQVEDTVAGLDSGADDYVIKPFRFDELLARIRVRLRDDPSDEPTILRVGEVTLDIRTRRASVD